MPDERWLRARCFPACTPAFFFCHPRPAHAAHNPLAPPRPCLCPAPGKYGPLPTFNGTETLACEWQSWSMMLPAGMELDAMDVIYQQVGFSFFALSN